MPGDRAGLLTPKSAATKTVIARLGNRQAIHRARLHPVKVLAALCTYAAGKGARDSSVTWQPVKPVIDALDAAFYLAFQAIEPTERRYLLGIDVSGSMTLGTIAGVPGLTPRIGAAAMALVTAATEPACTIMGFSHEFVQLPITASTRLDEACAIMDAMPYGATDCALPMRYALQHDLPIDAFVIYTDSETWYGDVHPVQALREYRDRTGIPAKLIVVGMVANNFSIADPNDNGMLDVVGFDTAAPALISDFVAQRFATPLSSLLPSLADGGARDGATGR